jgi:diketogulonate reductase-like aldo/keto reductase
LREHSPVVPAVNQFEIHPLLWESSTIDYCREHKIAIEAYSPLARQDERLFKSDVMLALSKKYNKTVAQLTFRWCLQNGFIVLAKSKTPSRI